MLWVSRVSWVSWVSWVSEIQQSPDPSQKVSPLNRYVLAIALGFVLCATLGASLAPLFLKPAVTPCVYLSTPVRFIRVDSVPVKTHRKTYAFPVVEYSYVVAGKPYTSTRMFCEDRNSVNVNWSKVARFFEDVRDGAEVVAWIRPSSPESACISPEMEFSYSVMSNSSAQCRAE